MHVLDSIMSPPISQKVFCDTSFFYASISRNDINHEEAVKRLEYALENSITFVTTWDIISETVTLLRYRSSYKDAIQFLDMVVPTLEIVTYDNSVRDEAKTIFRKLGKDKRISFCDAVSFVIVSVVLDSVPCFSFDRDFRSLGLTVI